MTSLFKLFSPLTTFTTLVAIASLVWFGIHSSSAPVSEADTAAEPVVPAVTLITAREYQSDASLTLLGTVAAASEAAVQSERGGQVVSVPVALGSTVGAGAVLMTFENASERAAVTQAEGAYEAAIASTDQGIARNESAVRNAEIAIASAESSIVQAIQTSYSTANNTLLNVLDQFYANPSGLFPGVRISKTDVSYMREERKAFQDILDAWRTEAQLTTYTTDSEAYLNDSLVRTERLTLLVDHIIQAINRANSSDVLNGQPVSSYLPSLIAERDRLVASAQNIRAAARGLTQAEESFRQARTQDTTGDTGLSDAQVKQAFGALQAAQANLQKTIIRSPIAGTINELTISVGDFVSPGTVLAEVVNDSGLEITTYLSERDFNALSVGDEVLLNGGITGTVTNLASTLSQSTGKREVRIAASDDSLTAGDSVRITVPLTNDDAGVAPSTMTLPLSAVRFDGTDGYVYLVESGELVRSDVTIATVFGTNVEISSGLTIDTPVVRDARGKQAGDVVNVIN